MLRVLSAQPSFHMATFCLNLRPTIVYGDVYSNMYLRLSPDRITLLPYVHMIINPLPLRN